MKCIDFLKRNPNQVFLIDGTGALITAISLLFLLPNLPELFQMPPHILRILGQAAVVLALYSWSHFFLKHSRTKLRIRIIALCNLIYCLVSIIFLYSYRQEISILDTLYFLFEIAIVMLLAAIEWEVSTQLSK